MINTASHNKQVAGWLLVVAAMIFLMVVLGGTTRLTRSGLSIVEWRLFEGTLPPLTEAHWQEMFDLYKKTPEYQKINVGMDLAGFEKIFWLEYLHRLWGRLIFFVALVPLLWFLWRGRIEKKLIPRMVAVPLLVALNGVLGWLMVASGLIDLPRVSPYRLTAHLGLAVAIYAYILWLALNLVSERRPVNASPELRRFAHTVTGLVFIMILSGGFVAGTKAGFAFNTFPWMNGRFFPEGMYAMQPFWINLFENIATVQFNHRLLAFLLCLVIPVFWWKVMRAGLSYRARRAAHLLLGWLVVQVLLGIATVVNVTPVSLGAAHQAGALVLFSLALYLLHTLRSRQN
ncbi:MAG: COX15/CtaA family protein [Sulfuricaulis sp.]|uniref:COX15/CtaA family protein n=1 Tax=Sulfuricaulis sp. TaxID=2003553 RepID=UPI0025F9F6A0|nr:COX15/CtaA family protein [Sulfuricaulis sp.]MCR4346668.1 COX15/CtaA family protein [Sulfuricaulis sp.]